MKDKDSTSSPVQPEFAVNAGDAALLQPHTEIAILKEFDVKKNGRNRHVTLEMHRTALLETGLPNRNISHAFHEKTYRRISKYNHFGSKNNLSKVYNGTVHSTHSDDSSIMSQDATDYNDYTPTVVVSPQSSPSRNTKTAHSFSSTRTNVRIGNYDALPAVPESDTDNNSIVSPPRVRAKDPSHWISRYLLDLNKVHISSLANKRVTLNLRYKADKQPEERHFAFASDHEAKEFRDTIQREKIQEKVRVQSKLVSALQNAGLANEAKNIDTFVNERLEFLVEIVGAEDLAAEDLTSSDPYVVCQF